MKTLKGLGRVRPLSVFSRELCGGAGGSSPVWGKDFWFMQKDPETRIATKNWGSYREEGCRGKSWPQETGSTIKADKAELNQITGGEFW